MTGIAAPHGHGGPAVAATTPLLIDVRNEAEHRAVQLPGAKLVPLPLLPALIGNVVPDRDTPLLVFCAAGGRAGMACAMLAAMGYTQVGNGGSIGAVAVRHGLTPQPGR